MLDSIVICIHNVASPQRLIDLAKVVFGLGDMNVLVASRITGMAAQTGVPEVMRYAYKLRKSFLVFPSLQDAIDLLKPDEVLLLVPEGFPEAESLNSRTTQATQDKRLLLVISGSEDGFTRADLGLGDAVYLPGVKEFLPSVALVAIALWILRQSLRQPRRDLF